MPRSRAGRRTHGQFATGRHQQGLQFDGQHLVQRLLYQGSPEPSATQLGGIVGLEGILDLAGTTGYWWRGAGNDDIAVDLVGCGLGTTGQFSHSTLEHAVLNPEELRQALSDIFSSERGVAAER